MSWIKKINKVLKKFNFLLVVMKKGVHLYQKTKQVDFFIIKV